jgi:single-strand DNA-binding protein
MSSNSCFLHGFVGQDAELKMIPSGMALLSFSLATSETWKTKEGEKKEKTQWHQIKVWGKQAEALVDYIKKGNELIIIGKIEYTEAPDKDNPNKKQYFTNIIADKIDFCGKRSDSSGRRESPDPDPPAYIQGQSNGGSDDRRQSNSAPASQPDYGDDSDIPF